MATSKTAKLAVTVDFRCKTTQKETCKVVYVDDDEHAVAMFMQELSNHGDYEMYPAQSGVDGLDILARTPGVQVVISDYQLPGMTGVEFLTKVSIQWPETVRLMLSGEAPPDEVKAALDRRIIHKFVQKPWDIHEFHIMIIDGIATACLAPELVKGEADL